ncbi:phage/plasmid replication protein, II/X family [Caenimonas aquaedulcis]|uniref:Replication-associated protein G2P N-terminal domain-containing protein n=1 Tax=Caenimonas aquaedulcis TaxID=2793270 RepID=A0A931MH36_9BURK|nr:phage/plasmid replication protein, II/X family [Caenimonas aquaedulcis]MBG9388384.1 hypothetical protein [Caenimonas aquaedulcis]
MNNESESGKSKPWFSSTFDTVGVKLRADGVDLYQLHQLHPKRVVYREGRYRVKSRFGTFAWLRSRRGQGVLFIEASVPKFLTGQNLVGTERLRQGAIELIDKVLARARIELSSEEVRSYRAGDFELTRVDYANHLWCGSKAHALVFMRALHRRTVAKIWNFTQYRRQTLYWSKDSKRWTMKAYLKALELKKRPMGSQVRARKTLTQKAEGMIRFELTLRGQELKRLGLNRPETWTPENARELLTERVKAVLPQEGQVIDLRGMEQLGDRTRIRLELFLLGQTAAFDQYERAKLDDRRDIREHTGFDIDSVLTPSEQHESMKTLLQMFEQGWGFRSREAKWEDMKQGKLGPV